MRTCPKCKTEYPDDKKFCKNCHVQLIFIKETDPKFTADIMAGESLKTPEAVEINPKLNNINASKTKRKYIFVLSGIAISIIAAIFLIRPGGSQNEKDSLESSNIIPETYSNSSTNSNTSNTSNNTNISSSTVKASLLEWHNSLGSFDYTNHIKYYAQTVKYFKKIVDLNYIAREKNLFFNSGVWQKINNNISDIRIVTINENELITYFNYDCEFAKNTGKVFSVNVDKMIVWKKIDGYWKITEERDVKLNMNRSHK